MEKKRSWKTKRGALATQTQLEYVHIRYTGRHDIWILIRELRKGDVTWDTSYTGHALAAGGSGQVVLHNYEICLWYDYSYAKETRLRLD